ncbi:MAG: glycosyltransferase family 9 protein [Candidatus Hydrogenedentes bacterium]|nr:glycosyltransferase family 9 protein [Candidatus Hydrogenedentota bacterium]
MTAPLKIGILFNVTEKSALLLKGVRRRHPGAQVVAVVSERMSLTPEDMAGADELLRLELSPVRLLFRGTLFSVAERLREQGFDLFVLRFGTLKLRLLAALVAPARCELWLIGGIIAPVNATGLFPTAREYFRCWLAGRKTVFSARCSACFQRVRPYSQRK